jgi:hypothetical protein
MCEKTDRRCFLARGVLGAAGVGAAYGSIEEDTLLAAMQDGATQPTGSARPKTDIPPGSLPCGKIGNVTISRLVIGGNLIAGWAHSRDLTYVSNLFRAYNTEAKILETLELAQACGINTIQFDAPSWRVVTKYNKSRATKLQTVICVRFHADKNSMKEAIQREVDLGVAMLYTHGGEVDQYMMQNGAKIDAIAQAVDLIKAQGIPAGVGTHSLEVTKACEKNNVNPDFYVKTFHTDRYWSATPKNRREEHDCMRFRANDHDANFDCMWCNNPEETAAFMQTVEKPWFAVKVMAAGAISPRMAFPYAYRHGADFIIAGMFDFQIESDVKIAIESLQKVRSRKRPWRA